MMEQYKPKRFGKEYVHLKNSDQYPMFAATALGVKPSYDDWIDISVFEDFRKVCRDYGLHVETDVVFRTPDFRKDDIIGSKNITTTFQVGDRFTPETKDGTVHVYVSASKKNAMAAKRFGWYSVVIKNRSTNKPFVDHLRFGKALGFPDCCVDFFMRYNNWNIYSHPFEAYKNTKRMDNRASGSYYCNNFLMDNTYFFIHNIPCSYRCENTISYARKVEEKLAKVEPGFVKKVQAILKRPLLVFGERNFMMFDGKMKGDSITYKDSMYFKNPGRPEDEVDFYKDIRSGDKLTREGDNLNIFKGRSLLKTTRMKDTWFMIDFD